MDIKNVIFHFIPRYIEITGSRDNCNIKKIKMCNIKKIEIWMKDVSG